MIIEIFSASTGKRDLCEKFILYEESGVKEYWIVYPESKDITVYLLQDDSKYDTGKVYEFEGQIPVHVFDNITINIEDIFL